MILLMSDNLLLNSVYVSILIFIFSSFFSIGIKRYDVRGLLGRAGYSVIVAFMCFMLMPNNLVSILIGYIIAVLCHTIFIIFKNRGVLNVRKSKSGQVD